jgi:competence protein ComFC
MRKTEASLVLSNLYEHVLDIFFPKKCFGCGVTKDLLCEQCTAELSCIIDSQICIVCRKPTPFGLTHVSCMTPLKPDGFLTVFDYNDQKVSSCIINGKYYFVKEIFTVLANLSARKLTEHTFQNLFETYTLTPIPLSYFRENWRGFNQSRVISEELSQMLELPVLEVLERNRHTKIQKDLKKSKRQENVKQSFTLTPNRALPENVLLIDDVSTTGSTFFEAASVLKRNGVKKVWCLAVAREHNVKQENML